MIVTDGEYVNSPGEDRYVGTLTPGRNARRTRSNRSKPTYRNHNKKIVDQKLRMMIIGVFAE